MPTRFYQKAETCQAGCQQKTPLFDGFGVAPAGLSLKAAVLTFEQDNRLDTGDNGISVTGGRPELLGDRIPIFLEKSEFLSGC
jgi:hypothetical protein